LRKHTHECCSSAQDSQRKKPEPLEGALFENEREQAGHDAAPALLRVGGIPTRKVYSELALNLKEAFDRSVRK
jgi:hypothetical protein